MTLDDLQLRFFPTSHLGTQESDNPWEARYVDLGSLLMTKRILKMPK